MTKFLYKKSVIEEIKKRAKDDSRVISCSIRNRKGKQYMMISLTDVHGWDDTRKVVTNLLEGLCPLAIMTSGGCFNATYRLNPDYLSDLEVNRRLTKK